MNKVVCQLTLIPVRREPDHRSEQVSQILFGETATILEENQNWHKIKIDFDSYTGWIERDSVSYLKKEDEITQKIIIKEPFTELMHNDGKIILAAGSEIALPDERGYIIIRGTKFLYIESIRSGNDSIFTDAMKFLHAPYQWGGRTVFGFDCSGFIQILFKINGYNLPRDAKKQASRGIEIRSFIESLPGDLLFFINETGEITHVGLYLGNYKIIHASKWVRIDTIDEKGIYCEKRKEYSHKLSCIRRIIH